MLALIFILILSMSFFENVSFAASLFSFFFFFFFSVSFFFRYLKTTIIDIQTTYQITIQITSKTRKTSKMIMKVSSKTELNKPLSKLNLSNFVWLYIEFYLLKKKTWTMVTKIHLFSSDIYLWNGSGKGMIKLMNRFMLQNSDVPSRNFVHLAVDDDDDVLLSLTRVKFDPHKDVICLCSLFSAFSSKFSHNCLVFA